jgi:hypothetical protein
MVMNNDVKHGEGALLPALIAAFDANSNAMRLEGALKFAAR